MTDRRSRSGHKVYFHHVKTRAVGEDGLGQFGTKGSLESFEVRKARRAIAVPVCVLSGCSLPLAKTIMDPFTYAR